MRQELLLPSRNPVKANYSDPKAKGQNRFVRVYRSGQCALCPATWSLTKHHLFGSSDRFTVQLCNNCHAMVHNEVNGGMVGPFSRHLIQMLAQVFPITTPLPEWRTNDE